MKRIRRSEYFIYTTIINVIAVICYFAVTNDIEKNTLLVVGIASLFLIGLQFHLTMKRLHDINLSGWYALLLFIPIINFANILLFFIDGTKGDNRYGKDPKNRTQENKVLKMKIDSKENELEPKLNLLEDSYESGLLNKKEYYKMKVDLINKQTQELADLAEQELFKKKNENLKSLWESNLLSQQEYSNKQRELEQLRPKKNEQITGYNFQTKIIIVQNNTQYGPMSVESFLKCMKLGTVKPEAFIRRETDSSFIYRAKDLQREFN